MATASGTATNYTNLYDLFVTFLTTTLPVGERWTVLSSETNPASITGGTRLTYLRAPGLAGTDNIYSVLYAFENVGSDYYNIGVRGATGYLLASGYAGQPGGSNPVYSLMWNSSIPYWFIGSGRRAMLIAKISTVYVCLHMGFITPYASPSEWGYPHFIGGTWGGASATRWSDATALHKAFWNPANTAAGGTTSPAKLYYPGASWIDFQNYTTTESSYTATGSRIFPFSWVNQETKKIGRIYGGTEYALYPLVLFNESYPSMYGEIEGVYQISGYSNAAENIVTISAVNYLVVPNVFRAAVNHYAAFKLA
jgi:hypothetical protein